MTLEEIRKNAPPQATHYKDGSYYYADGWFLNRWDGLEWVIVDMYPITDHLQPLH